MRNEAFHRTRPASLEAQVQTGSGCFSGAACWQVFGLRALRRCAEFLLSTASRIREDQCSEPCGSTGGGRSRYRCGAAPDFHRVPS